MGNHFLFLSSFTALILYIQLMQILGASVSDGLTKLAESRPTTEKSKYITQNAEIQQILHLMKEMSDMLKEKQRVGVSDIFQMSIELQLLNLNLRLQDIEHKISEGEPTGTCGKNKIKPAKDNDLEEESRVIDLKLMTEKNSQQTMNIRIEDVEKLLRSILTTQEILLKEVIKQGVSQIQLMTNLNELKRNLELDWEESKQNKNTTSQQFLKDVNINTSTQTAAEQIESVQFAINECMKLTQENDNEMKLDLANMITSFEEGMTDEIKKLNIKNSQQLKSVDKLVKGYETLKKNYNAMQQYGQKLEDKVTSALHKISDKIDDKTESLLSELNCLLKNEFQLSEKKILEKKIRCAKHNNAGDGHDGSDLLGSTKILTTSEAQLPTAVSKNIRSKLLEETDIFDQMEDNSPEELPELQTQVLS